MAVSGTGQGETPQSLATPAFAGFPPIAESGTKAALTTGMTTDRKNFIFTVRRGIMAEIEYPGIAKLVSRLVWECRGGIRDRVRRNAAKPCDTCDCGISTGCRKRHKIAFDHRNDHRQEKTFKSHDFRAIIMTTKYPGVVQLVARDIWDVEAARSSRATRTKPL